MSNNQRLGCTGAALLGGLLQLQTHGHSHTDSSKLTALDLSEYMIGDVGVAVLAASLRSNRRLTSLTLDSNGLGEEGAGLLAEALIPVASSSISAASSPASTGATGTGTGTSSAFAATAG